jgi:GDP-L-fucose synthase
MTSPVRVLITGGSGLLGRALVRELSSREGVLTLAPSRREVDLLDPARLGQFLWRQPADVLVHLAADCGGIGYNVSRPASMMHANAVMALNVFEAARACGVPRVICAASCDAYPAGAGLPWREESLWDGLPEPTSAPYGLAKRFAISLGDACQREHGIEVLHLVFINMFGEDDRFDLARGHVIPATIVKIAEAQRRGERRVEVWGSGSPERELLYAADAARITVQALAGPGISGCLNVGSGSVHTIRDITGQIASTMGFDGDLVFDPSRPDGHPLKVLDTTRLRAALGGPSAFTPFGEALRRTVGAFRRREAGSR